MHEKLAGYRGAPPAGLRYAADHIDSVHPEATRRHPIPVRPVLGLPALRHPGQALRVQYLQKTPEKRATPPRQLWLARRGAPCPGPDCQALPEAEVRAVTPLSKEVTQIRIRTRIPTGLAPGLYDLVHRWGAWRRRSPSAVKVTRAGETTRTAAPSSGFTFVHLTDLHQGPGPDKRLRTTLAWVNRLRPRPAFAVITGDLVEYGPNHAHWKRVQRALLRLELPVFVIPGNHDYYRAGLGGTTAPPDGHVEERGLRHFVRTFHPFLSFTFTHRGYRFYAVDTGPGATLRSYKQGRLITTEGLGGPQLRALRHQMSRAPWPRGHVLLGHAPPRARVTRTDSGCAVGRHGGFLLRRAALERLLLETARRQRRPVLFLHGHLHWNDLYARSDAPRCQGFRAVNALQPRMGSLPCWSRLSTARSPLLVGTQSATKHNALRSGGLLQRGMQHGEGAGAARGFRLLRINKRRIESALYRLHRRTAVRHREHPEGHLPASATNHPGLPRCESPPRQQPRLDQR